MSSPDPFGAALDQQAQSASNADYFDAALTARAKGKGVLTAKPVDPEIHEGPIGFVNGIAEIGGKSLASIPHAMAHGAVDLWRRATGGDTNAPDPAGYRRYLFPR